MVSFGPFTFDAVNGLLRRAGSEVPLPPRVLGVLAYLVSRPGQVVARQDLIDAIWKDAFVTDTSLAEAVSSLRQALGDDPQQPVYIQTLHRRGYRFVAPLSPTSAITGSGAPSAHAPAPGADALLPGAPSAEASPVVPSIAASLLPWSLAAILGALAAAAIWRLEYADPRPEPPAARFVVDLPAGSRLDGNDQSLAIAADGSRLAWSACILEQARCGIWTRALDDLDAAFVDGTEGGRTPFFAPDTRRIGFFAGGKLLTISLAGGTPLAIADAAEARGASWGRDGRIVFAGIPAAGLAVVGETGGRVEPLTRLDPAAGEQAHGLPFHLPGTDGIVFTIATARGVHHAAVVDGGGGARRTLLDDARGARVGAPGLLVFKRGTELAGVSWDDRLRAIAGAPAPLAADVNEFALSRSGTLAIARPDRLVVALQWAREARKRVPPGVGRLLR
ncbi:MAG TPA: transcriptional regulator [Vicinamibacterales bacterium]|jgi:DNA-binding winged helix-turn-helix (wHTH) protein|nr:transcriptional regulator [Vicinamibacterales bacterium]